MSFFKNIFSKIGFSKEEKVTGSVITSEDSSVIASEAKQSISVLIDHAYLEKLEEDLIRSDLGVDLSLEYSELIEKKFLNQELDKAVLVDELKDFLLASFDTDKLTQLVLDKSQKNIFLIVGVNGVGKTTSIGKLANLYNKDGFKTLIAAADTFRAAAEAQLELWAKRASVDIIQLDDNAKPSAVVYKAIEKIKVEDYNMLLIDTAGRLQNKKDLMAELAKLNDVIHKNMSPVIDSEAISSPRHCQERSDTAISQSRHCQERSDAEIHSSYNLKTLLVLDATTGSNAISQAENFNEVTKLDGIILTKFDGSAKAGVVFSLARKFNLPVYYIGTGEGLEDISAFDLDEFMKKYL
jgi:fused signal recognition particle receptor